MNLQIIGAMALTGIGGYLLVRALWQYSRDKKALKWPTVPGMICKSEVMESWEDIAGTSSLMFGARIEYMYQIDGMRLTGDRVHQVETSTSGRVHAEGVIARYPVGMEVEVIYNPENPSESLLRSAMMSPGLLILFLLLGGGMFSGGVIWQISVA